jgi:hypothetical protein
MPCAACMIRGRTSSSSRASSSSSAIIYQRALLDGEYEEKELSLLE